MREAVRALERVRTQLARTQRTLDAFVEQIAASAGDDTGRAAHAERTAPPASLADHVIAPDPPTDGPAR